MAAWVRLVAVACLAGLAACPRAQPGCPITDPKRYRGPQQKDLQGMFGLSEATLPFHNAVWHYDVPRVKCLVEKMKVRPDSGVCPPPLQALRWHAPAMARQLMHPAPLVFRSIRTS